MARYIPWSIALLCLLAPPGFAQEAVNQPPTVKQISSARLINLKNQSIIVEYKEIETIFHDKILEEEMKARGVLIPPALRSRFGNKDRVRLNEPEFQAAFREVFCSNVFNHHDFEWQGN